MALVSPVLIWARMSRLQKLTVILPPPYNVSKENFSFLRSPDFSFPPILLRVISSDLPSPRSLFKSRDQTISSTSFTDF